jgi:two-component system LytT family response regulator
MTMRIVIADDEPLSRARLRRLLQGEHDVEIVAECGDGAAAAEAIRKLRPELVLLDIEMPELDGFDVLDDLGDSRPPAVIFVTAYDRHAIRAFEARALDYVLKPVERTRLHAALERARGQIAQQNVGETLTAILRQVRGESAWLERIAVRSRGRISFVRFIDVTRLESAGNYVRLWLGKDSHLVRETLAQLEARLDPKRFVRIHRSTIVNIEQIRELRPWFGGDAVLVLIDGSELTVSRTYRTHVMELLAP